MKLAEVLDRLIAISIDGQNRYHHASLDVGKSYLEHFFDDQSQARKRAADELRAERDRLGIGTGESGTVAGTLDTAAMDFSVIMSMGDTGVVDWCRKDAQQVIDEFQKALAEDLPQRVRSLIERLLGEVRTTAASLDQVLEVYRAAKS